MITVVGVVFSITIVALQLASSQYSPRVLRNFMRDRASQITLGSFIGAFVYSLLVLRTVRADADGRDEFVPVLAVSGADLLAVVAVALLVYFIHHIATRMQAAYITATVATETLDEIDRQTRATKDRDDGAAAYFVAAEALTNVAKYAAAGHIELTAETDAHQLRIEISDDGVGGADPAGGSGLRGLGDRVAALGGQLDIRSPVGMGTRVVARLPLIAGTELPA